MKISSSLSGQNRAGFALLITLSFLVIILIVFASTMYWITSNATLTQRNDTYITSEAAAEGATETAFAVMDRDYLRHALNYTASAYTGLLPNQTGWPVQYVFSDTNGNQGQISVSIGTESSTLQPLGSQFANLEGYPTPVTITATATPTGQLHNVPSTVSQTFNFASVPAFQYAIFYNLNLEICPGQPMTISGAVFSNQNIWEGSKNTKFTLTVQAVGTNDLANTNPFCSNYAPQDVPATFSMAGQPVDHADPLVIPIGAGTNNNPTNVEAIINLPPAAASAPLDVAYTSTNQTYDFNAASLIVSNWSNGTNGLGGGYTDTGNNFTVYLQDNYSPNATSHVLPHWTQLTNDYYIVTNNKTASRIITNTLFGLPGFVTNNFPSYPWTQNTHIVWTNNVSGHSTNYGVMYAGFSFLTNVAFPDFRESSTVQAVQIDVAALRAWITNSAANSGSNWNFDLCEDTGQGINSIFVYNDVKFSSSQLPAVRVINGYRLPNSTNYVYYNNTNAYITTRGLSVITPQPLYVLGNYNVQIDGDGTNSFPSADTHNTSHTYPASFLADAITVLSANWSDSNSIGQAVGLRTPVSTTINAACLEGIVPSSGSTYSGGVENFLRLLENWQDSTSTELTYNGSIMVMFPSIYATNYWSNLNSYNDNGAYYAVPMRNWGFDTNFLVQSKLPPLTPQFRTVVRNQWSGY